MNSRRQEKRLRTGGARGRAPRLLTFFALFGVGLIVLLFASAAFTFLGPGTRTGSAASAALTEEAILEDPATPTLAPKGADVTVVMFFDYQCPVCRRMHPVLERVRKEDGRIRLVYKDWPIFAGASITAAKVAIAAHWQGKYHAVHDALMRTPGKLDDARIKAAVERAGVDWPRLQQDLEKRGGEIDALLGRTLIQARGLGFQGTPSFAIGPYLVSGGLDDAGFRSAIARAREQQRANPASSTPVRQDR